MKTRNPSIRTNPESVDGVPAAMRRGSRATQVKRGRASFDFYITRGVAVSPCRASALPAAGCLDTNDLAMGSDVFEQGVGWQGECHAVQHQAFFSVTGREQPVTPVGLAAVDLKGLGVRVHQSVFLQGADGAIAEEFVASVKGSGAGRQHLDDELGVLHFERCSQVSRIAGDQDVGVKEIAGLGDVDFHVTRKGATWRALQVRSKRQIAIASHVYVLPARPAHAKHLKHLALKELVAQGLIEFPLGELGSTHTVNGLG